MRLLKPEEIEELRGMRERLIIIEAVSFGIYGNWWIEMLREVNDVMMALTYQFSFLPLIIYLLFVISKKRKIGDFIYYSINKLSYLWWFLHILLVYFPLYKVGALSNVLKDMIFNLTGFFIWFAILIIGRIISELPNRFLKE